MLLVEENDGTWSMPGGWVDVMETVKSNTVKEVKEEAGLDVDAVRAVSYTHLDVYKRQDMRLMPAVLPTEPIFMEYR